MRGVELARDTKGKATVSGWIADTRDCLRFFTRIPVGGQKGDAHAMPDLSAASRALPIAGAIVGVIGAVVLVVADFAGLPVWVSAVLAIAATVIATGAFHEDGLADTADGFGDGTSIEKKLEIMRDSRIGTYGACALILSLMARAGLLAGLMGAMDANRAALVIIAAESVSRTGALALSWRLQPVRRDGAAHAAGQPGAPAVRDAVLVALVICFSAVASAAGVGATLTGIAAAALASVIMMRLADHQIGGQTGDVAGATQQVSLLAFLAAILISVS